MNHSFGKWLQNIFQPVEMQYREKALEDVAKAIQSQSIQKVWLDAMVERIRQINMEIDNLLAKEDKQRIWETLAIERRTLIACLRMILDAQDNLDSERLAQEAQNKLFERYRGISAPSGVQ